MAGLAGSVHAQVIGPQLPPGGVGGTYNQSASVPFATNMPVALPGRWWFASNFVDQGVGYEGSYLTLGASTRLFEDGLAGRWVGEARGHVSVESGGFFGNVGIHRKFSITSANADVSTGFFFDYDDDQQGPFAHTFTQVSANASIKTPRYELIGNGYFPIGTTDYTQGDPTGVNCFFNNSIVLIPGIDSALKGFDARVRVKPEQFGHWNGAFELGAYGYNSAVIPFFGGVKAGAGFQAYRGWIVNFEANYDDRFDLTGLVNLQIRWGVNARGAEYALTATDLDPTIRNDHIVRVQQDLVLAIDPDTGRPYNVFHVDNTADPAFATGAVDTRFTNLLDAQNASGPDDIIFVHEGDGTTRNYDRGIVLKEGQYLLGDGVRHEIPVQNGQIFVLCNDIDGNVPTITNRNGGPVVTLAGRNIVRGFNIDATTGGVTNAIQGDGATLGRTINNGIIADITILGNPILNGISLNEIGGNWRFARNNLTGAQFDGIFIDNACDPNSIFTFEDNVASNNGRDGIHIEDYDGASFTFLNNTTNGNGRDGVRLERFKNTAGTGAEFLIAGHVADGNNGTGFNIIDSTGNFRILNNNMSNNVGNGLSLQGVVNLAGQSTLIGTTTGGTSTYSGNGNAGGAGINIDLDRAGTQSVLITDTTVDTNGTGIRGRSGALGAALTMNIVDNLSISTNNSDGMRFQAVDGSTMNVLVENTGAALTMANNGAIAGNGISFFSGNASGGFLSSMSAIIRNVNLTGTGTAATNNGIFGSAILDGQLNVLIDSSAITGTAGTGVNFNFDTNATAALNRMVLRDTDVTGNGNNAFTLISGTDTLADFVIINSTTTGANNGISANFTGSAAPDADNLTRLFVQNSVFNGYTFSGVDIDVTGDANALIVLDGNIANNNGPGTDATMLPYFHGFSITNTGSGQVDARVTNNIGTGNFERGFIASNAGAGTMNLLMVGNNFSNNDTGEDTGNDPIIDSNIEDVLLSNGALGTMCVAMSNNTSFLNWNFTNIAAGVSYTIELDGVTNVGPLVFNGAFTFAPFGTVCEPAIIAREGVFAGNGFPPQ